MTTAPRLAQATRDLADDYLGAGFVEAPILLRTLASIVDGDCPMHGREPLTVPVDGREVDTESVLLTPGSYEVPAEMEQRYGRDLLDEINRPSPADQIRRDEATRKKLGNP